MAALAMLLSVHPTSATCLQWASNTPAVLSQAYLPSAVIVVLQKYVQTPNLAEYLGLNPVDALHLSVPLNIIFIGFKGEGNSKVSIAGRTRGWPRLYSCHKQPRVAGRNHFAGQLSSAGQACIEVHPCMHATDVASAVL